MLPTVAKRVMTIAYVWLLLAIPALAQLNFNSGPSTVSMGPYLYYFTPSGGTGPYTFAYAPGAPVIPGLRVIPQPEFPANAPVNARGALVGLPVAPGTYNTTIRMSDTGTGQFLDKAFTLNVNVLSLIGYIPNSHGAGATITSRFWGVGGTPPYRFSVSSGSLPTGLNLDLNTGFVTGTLLAAGSFSYSIRLEDSAVPANSATSSFTTSVSPLRLVSVPDRILPNGTVNHSYSQTLTVTGGSGAYTFALGPSETLPAGLTLTGNGLLSGIPTSQIFNGAFDVVIQDTTTPIPNQVTVRMSLSILPQVPVPLAIETGDVTDIGIGSHEDDSLLSG